MIDAAHNETDKMLEKLERRIAREYNLAMRQMKKKAADYLKQFNEADKKQKALVQQGLLSQEDYNKWRLAKMATGKRWNDMRDTLAQDLANSTLIARKMMGEDIKDVYALNYNYGTYEIEHGIKANTSFTLYDHATVEHLLKDNPQILPQPGKKTAQAIAEGKAKKWSNRKLQSVMTQSILQGESIPNIAKRLVNSVGEMEKTAAIRNARTMTTSAESAGRVDSYKRAVDMGIKMKQVWLATLDGRTRHEHRILDGQQREVGKPFEVDGYKIMYPGDYSAPGYLIYNCRCRLIAAVEGSNLYDGIEGVERDSKLGSMSYEEWKHEKQKQQQIKIVQESKYYKKWDKEDLIKQFKDVNVSKSELESVYGEYDFDRDIEVSVGYIQTDNSTIINKKLRSGSKLNKAEQKTVDDLDAIISRNALPDDILVARGVDFNFVRIITDKNYNFDDEDIIYSIKDEISKPDFSYVEKGFLSTTAAGMENVIGFGKRKVILELKVDKGTHCFITDNFAEGEIIFGRNSEIEFEDIFWNDNGQLVFSGKIIKQKKKVK